MLFYFSNFFFNFLKRKNSVFGQRNGAFDNNYALKTNWYEISENSHFKTQVKFIFCNF